MAYNDYGLSRLRRSTYNPPNWRQGLMGEGQRLQARQSRLGIRAPRLQPSPLPSGGLASLQAPGVQPKSLPMLGAGAASGVSRFLGPLQIGMGIADAGLSTIGAVQRMNSLNKEVDTVRKERDAGSGEARSYMQQGLREVSKQGRTARQMTALQPDKSGGTLSALTRTRLAGDMGDAVADVQGTAGSMAMDFRRQKDAELRGLRSSRDQARGEAWAAPLRLLPYVGGAVEGMANREFQQQAMEREDQGRLQALAEQRFGNDLQAEVVRLRGQNMADDAAYRQGEQDWRTDPRNPANRLQGPDGDVYSTLTGERLLDLPDKPADPVKYGFRETPEGIYRTNPLTGEVELAQGLTPQPPKLRTGFAPNSGDLVNLDTGETIMDYPDKPAKDGRGGGSGFSGFDPEAFRKTAQAYEIDTAKFDTVPKLIAELERREFTAQVVLDEMENMGFRGVAGPDGLDATVRNWSAITNDDGSPASPQEALAAIDELAAAAGVDDPGQLLTREARAAYMQLVQATQPPRGPRRSSPQGARLEYGLRGIGESFNRAVQPFRRLP